MKAPTQRIRWAGFAALATSMLVAACGGGGGGGSEEAPLATRTCDQLASATVPAADIGLPTTGAAVTTAVVLPAGGSGPAAHGPYCLVSGNIRPVDASAPDIQFRLALPNDWNGKVAMFGGGGWNGFIFPLDGAAPLSGSSSYATPLARGYAVFASDSGHQTAAGVSPAAFTSNAEAYRNYVGDALKKTRDVAMSLLTSRYGRAPGKAYFMGSSKGGGEAITVAQRWPADWDGIIAAAPGWNFTLVGLHMLHASQVFAAPGAWLNEGKRTVLYQAALEACDHLDGLRDAVISNVQGCAAAFNPATASLSGVLLRCVGGVDTGDTCLSDTQLTALKKVSEPTPLGYTLGSGESSLPGYPVYFADNGGGAGDATQKAFVALFGPLGMVPPAYPLDLATMSVNWQLGDEYGRYLLAGDPDFTGALSLDIPSGGGYRERLLRLSALDANIADLTPFQARQGKLLLLTGTADRLISPRSTEFLYYRMQSAMGAAKVDAFARFYQIPGEQHSPISPVFEGAWDKLSALEDWAERGIDPADRLTMADEGGVPGRTRPVCRFPSWPKYKGTGDVNSASSFTCATS
jgi:hypothetical protein